MKYAVIAGVSAVALAGCAGVPAVTRPAPTVTVTQESTPSHQSTAGMPDADTQRLMKMAWDDMPASSHSAMCATFKSSPEGSFSSFNEGSKYPVSRADFYSFFYGVCGS